MKQGKTSAILLFAFLISCSGVKETGKDGNGIINHQENGRINSRKFYLRNDYGIIIRHISFVNLTRFILFNAKDSTVYATFSYEKFKTKMKQTVPSGKRIDSYAPCANGFHEDMEKEYVEKSRIFAAENGIIFAGTEDSRNIMCTCVLDGV